MRSLSRRRLIALALPILNLSPISRNSFNRLGRKKVNPEEEVKRKGNKNRKKDLFPFLLFLREKRFFQKRVLFLKTKRLEKGEQFERDE